MKKRKFRNADEARREREANDSWNRLLEEHSRPLFAAGRSYPTVPSGKSKIPDYSSIGSRRAVVERRRMDDVRIVERVHTGNYTGPSVEKDHYTSEDGLLYREIKAQEEIERKKKRVGIAYNKGNYVYLSDAYDPKDLGRK